MKKTRANKSRRRFLSLAVLGGGGLALGLYLGLGGESTRKGPAAWGDKPKGFAPNAWLRVAPDGRVTVRIAHSEMGQGVSTGCAAMVAEEMDAAWNQVGFEFAPVEEVYKNPAFNIQMTGGSTATPHRWEPMRRAGAVARHMLVAAAAARWDVQPAACRTLEGRVIHPDGKKSLGYGELAAAAAGRKPPEKVRLKNPGDYKLIGQSLPRLDTVQKIRGQARFGQDVELPGLLNAAVIHPPIIGASLAGFKADEALKMPGVRRVLAINGGLAVVADTWWQAHQASKKLEARWSGGLAELSSPGLWEKWRGLGQGGEAKQLQKLGDPEAALAGADKVVRAEYRLPFQAHATPEPMNCTAWVEPGRCRVWAPTQNQDGCQEVAARLTGLGYGQVEVFTTFLGGGFGRRGVPDYAIEAVEISGKLGKPVKVMWSREEDLANDWYRPASLNLMKAGLDKKGNLVAWSHRIVGPDQMTWQLPFLLPSMLPYWLPRGVRNLSRWTAKNALAGRVAGDGVKEGGAPLPYQVPNVLVDYVADDPGVPCGFWRGVGHTANAFVVDCFLDEVAAEAGRDPEPWRGELLAGNPRLANAFSLAVESLASGAGPGPGKSFGFAAHSFHDACIGMGAEVSVEKDRIKVHRVAAGVDCGRVLNPRIVRDQIAGAVAFGLSATLKGEVTFSKGRPQQSNFHDFPIVNMAEMPEVEVRLVASDLAPKGIGEAGVPPVAPAVANAVSNAIGQRVRSLPIKL